MLQIGQREIKEKVLPNGNEGTFKILKERRTENGPLPVSIVYLNYLILYILIITFFDIS